MNNRIQKERIYLFSPTANICVIAGFNRRIEKPELEQAILTAVNHQEILCSRVVVNEDGSAFFEPNESREPVILEEYGSDWKDTAAEQEQVPFHLGKGETIRFFFSQKENGTEFLIISHHIIGDGKSMMIFMDGLMKVLNGEPISFRPLQLMSENDVPKHPQLNPLMRIILNRTNSKWSKSGKTFSLDAYEPMFAGYQEKHKTTTLVHTFGEDQLGRLLQAAHENKISLNSMLAAAFAATDSENSGIGIAADMRPEGFQGMGNYATCVSIRPAYDTAKNFLQNAVDIHGAIEAELKNAKNRYFLYEFMNAVPPTLIDSMYFSMAGAYTNPITESFRKMCGYVAQPTGASLTNLTTIKLTENSEPKYRLQSLFFVPPYIPNVSRVIGASTYRGNLTLTSHFPESNSLKESGIFANAWKLLDDLVSE